MWFDNLRIALRKRGMSQSELARRLEVTRTTVSNWCSGQRTPSLANMRAIARALDMSIAEILGQEIILAETKEERDVIEMLRELPPETRTHLISVLRSLAETSHNE